MLGVIEIPGERFILYNIWSLTVITFSALIDKWTLDGNCDLLFKLYFWIEIIAF